MIPNPMIPNTMILGPMFVIHWGAVAHWLRAVTIGW